MFCKLQPKIDCIRKTTLLPLKVVCLFDMCLTHKCELLLLPYLLVHSLIKMTPVFAKSIKFQDLVDINNPTKGIPIKIYFCLDRCIWDSIAITYMLFWYKFCNQCDWFITTRFLKCINWLILLEEMYIKSK